MHHKSLKSNIETTQIVFEIEEKNDYHRLELGFITSIKSETNLHRE